MIRYLLAFFFFLMYAGDNLGLNVSLGPGTSSKNFILYSIFFGIAINSAVAKNRRLELLSVITPFALLIVYALITWIAVAFVFDIPDYNMRASFIKLKSSLGDEFLTFIIFFYGVIYAKDAIWLLRLIIWIVIAGNVITLVDAFNVPDLGLVEARPSDGRFEGFLGSVNGYGAFLALFLPLSIALYLSEKGRTRILAGVGVVSTAFALVLTFSRGAWAGVIMGSIFASVYLRHYIRAQILFRFGFMTVAICAMVVVVTIAIGYSDMFSERLGRFEGSMHVATSGRSTIWMIALKAMLENPVSFITGNGYNSYEMSRSFYIATHNHFLNYLYNLGIIGLSLFLMFFIRILAITRATIVNATADERPFLVSLIFGLFALLVSQMFQEYHATGILLMATLGITMRVVVEIRRTREAQSGNTSSKKFQVRTKNSSPERIATAIDWSTARNRGG